MMSGSHGCRSSRPAAARNHAAKALPIVRTDHNPQSKIENGLYLLRQIILDPHAFDQAELVLQKLHVLFFIR